MDEFTVSWEIQLEASSPDDAARRALEIQRDPTSTATVFDVYFEGAEGAVTVDLTHHVDVAEQPSMAVDVSQPITYAETSPGQLDPFTRNHIMSSFRTPDGAVMYVLAQDHPLLPPNVIIVREEHDDRALSRVWTFVSLAAATRFAAAAAGWTLS